MSGSGGGNTEFVVVLVNVKTLQMFAFSRTMISNTSFAQLFKHRAFPFRGVFDAVGVVPTTEDTCLTSRP